MSVFTASYAEALRQRVQARSTVEERGYTSPCWISDRAAAGSGGEYTKIGVTVEGRHEVWYTHRLAYALFVGPVPTGLVIDHRCEQKKCCNPRHLAAVTQRENLLRSDSTVSRQKAQRVCLRGHRFDGVNTYTDRRGRRHCRACKRMRRSGHPPAILTAGEVARQELRPRGSQERTS